MTTRLLIDNSNTRTKFIRADGAKLCGDVRSLPTSSLSPSAVQDLLRGWEYDAAVICSVVPDAVKILRAALSCPSFEISASFPTSLGKQLLRYYPHPETLGADRLANAAAVAAHFRCDRSTRWLASPHRRSDNARTAGIRLSSFIYHGATPLHSTTQFALGIAPPPHGDRHSRSNPRRMHPWLPWHD